MIKTGGRKIRSQVHKHINSNWNKEELSEQWKESIIAPIYKKGHKTDCSKQRGISILSTTYKILSNILLSTFHMQRKLLGIINVDFNAVYHLLITYSVFVKYLKRQEYDEAVHQLLIDFRKDYDSVSREVLCDIFSKFSISMKLVRLIKVSE